MEHSFSYWYPKKNKSNTKLVSFKSTAIFIIPKIALDVKLGIWSGSSLPLRCIWDSTYCFFWNRSNNHLRKKSYYLRKNYGISTLRRRHLFLFFYLVVNNLITDNWIKVIFSDETRMCIGQGDDAGNSWSRAVQMKHRNICLRKTIELAMLYITYFCLSFNVHKGDNNKLIDQCIRVH